MKVVDRSSSFGKHWKLQLERKKTKTLKSLKVVWLLVAFLRFWMEIRKLFVCTVYWFNSGSKSTFTFLTKKYELLHADFL